MTMPIAALHESVSGTKRRCRDVRFSAAYGARPDIHQAGRTNTTGTVLVACWMTVRFVEDEAKITSG
jgi:hypothetical protein